MAAGSQWGRRETRFTSHLFCPAPKARSAWLGCQQNPHNERLRSALVTTLPSHPAQHQRCPSGCLNHRCSTSIWHFALQSIRCLMPVSAPVPTLLKWRNPAQHQPDTAPFSWRGFICCIDKVARYVEGEGLGLCSHAPKAVEKPENAGQSDVNKQVLHILLSQIFRSLKRIGRVIESSWRQLYPVLPALTQLITQSFTWQVDRVMHFHMGEQFFNKASQPKQHKKAHHLVPLILISTGWKRNFRSFFAPVLLSSPLPDITAFQHQNLFSFTSWILLTFSLRGNRNYLSCVRSLVLLPLFLVGTSEDVILDALSERDPEAAALWVWKVLSQKMCHWPGMQRFWETRCVSPQTDTLPELLLQGTALVPEPRAGCPACQDLRWFSCGPEKKIIPWKENSAGNTLLNKPVEKAVGWASCNSAFERAEKVVSSNVKIQ